MKTQYMISRWLDAGLAGTACLFRTDDKEAWMKKVTEVSKEFNLNSSNSEIVTGRDLIIFSFTDANNTSSWRNRFK